MPSAESLPRRILSVCAVSIIVIGAPSKAKVPEGEGARKQGCPKAMPEGELLERVVQSEGWSKARVPEKANTAR